MFPPREGGLSFPTLGAFEWRRVLSLLFVCVILLRRGVHRLIFQVLMNANLKNGVFWALAQSGGFFVAMVQILSRRVSSTKGVSFGNVLSVFISRTFLHFSVVRNGKSWTFPLRLSS